MRNVVRPTLTRVGDIDHDVAVVVAPGGGYRFLAIEHEGFAVARRLCERGVTAYVLEYRVVPTPADEPAFREALAATFAPGRDWRAEVDALVDDGPQAIRRARALGHERVVMVGFSAGALLTIRTLQSDTPPDAAALIYPPFVDDLTVAPDDAPPIFTVMAMDDPLSTRGASGITELWREAGRPAELHLFERGGHGFGMNETGLPVDRWIDLLGHWLASHDLLPREISGQADR